MHKLLICTVGGSHEPILRAVEAVQPDFVLFVCSRDDEATGRPGSYIQIVGKGNIVRAHGDSKPTLPNIPTQIGLEEDRYAHIRVSADDFDSVYSGINDWLERNVQKGQEIVADYTGGTKTMSAALVAVALDRPGIRLQLVTGPRVNLVKVESGMEIPLPAGVARTRFRRQLAQALVPWRRHAYDEAETLLEDIGAPQDPRLLGEYHRALNLSRAFAAWDRFQHDRAHELLSAHASQVGTAWPSLLGDLSAMTGDRPAREPLRLFDLWRNAQRRSIQGRYDDAVARLYRLLEWSAQWLLRTRAGIDTADVPAERVPEHLTLHPNREGRFQAGLYQAWQLAAVHCGQEVNDFWKSESRHLLDLLKMRNHSILAHGFAPLGEEEWRRFAQWTEERLLPLLLDSSGQAPWRVKKLPAQLPVKMLGS